MMGIRHLWSGEGDRGGPQLLIAGICESRVPPLLPLHSGYCRGNILEHFPKNVCSSPLEGEHSAEAHLLTQGYVQLLCDHTDEYDNTTVLKKHHLRGTKLEICERNEHLQPSRDSCRHRPHLIAGNNLESAETVTESSPTAQLRLLSDAPTPLVQCCYQEATPRST